MSCTALPAELLLGFALALLVDHRHGVLDRLQSLLILPMMLTPVAVGVIWKLMLNPEVGILSYLVRGVGIEPPQWLSDPGGAPDTGAGRHLAMDTSDVPHHPDRAARTAGGGPRGR